MACRNVEEYTTEYGKIADEIKSICTNRACTLDAIQKALEEKGTIVSEGTIVAMTSQIIGMMKFDKRETYDLGDTIEYKKGKIFKLNMLANLLVKVSYKRFYLYNSERYKDDAFREHIHSKLEFEVSEKNTISCTSELEAALADLNIPIEKWEHYVFVSEISGNVFCMKKNTDKNYTSKVNIGKFVRQYTEKG